MRRAIHLNPMATAALVLLAGGWIWLGLLWASRLNFRYAGSWWVEGAAYVCYMFAPVALLLAVGGLIWEDEKRLSWWAMALSVASLALVIWIFR